MEVKIRNYESTDSEELNETVLQAFTQFSSQYNEWEALCERIGSMSSLSSESEIIVAEYSGKFSGAVAYYKPGEDKIGYFQPDWASIRLLVVNPASRGKGIGRMLMNECVKRASRDSASAIGLHTSPIMNVALSMYLRMGFQKVKDIQEIHGVPYSTYRLQLSVEGV